MHHLKHVLATCGFERFFPRKNEIGVIALNNMVHWRLTLVNARTPYLTTCIAFGQRVAFIFQENVDLSN